MAKILVLDDDARVTHEIRGLLEGDGHEVTTCADGEQGWDVCRKGSFDLVITDLIMPGREGVETMRMIKKEFPDMDVIAISGGGNFESDFYLNAASRLGASRVMAKPLDRDLLRELVTELIGGKGRSIS